MWRSVGCTKSWLGGGVGGVRGSCQAMVVAQKPLARGLGRSGWGGSTPPVGVRFAESCGGGAKRGGWQRGGGWS
eukprot:3294139-Prorocentrum_lima.AAC.1